MEKNIEDLMKKVDEVHRFLLGGGKGIVNSGKDLISDKSNINLRKAIQKAVEDLDKTKSMFKSREIMKIREDLMRAIEKRI